MLPLTTEMRSCSLASVFIATLLTVPCFGQSVALRMGSASSLPGAVVALPITLTSTGTQPSSLQFRVTYLPSSIVSIAVSTGPAATAAGKNVRCFTTPGSAMCVVSGLNATAIGNGVVATATVQVGSAVVSGTVLRLSLVDSIGSSSLGAAIVSTATGADLSVLAAVLTSVKSVSCSLTSILPPASVTCSVTLTLPAPSGGVAIALTSSSTALKLPAAVTVAAGTASATFTATVTSVLALITAQLTAILNGSSAATTLSLLPGAALSSIRCDAAYLFAATGTNCTVTLASSAPASTTIALQSSHAAVLSVQPSVTIPAGSSTATFLVLTGASPAADIAAGISASLNGITMRANVTLLAATLSAVDCVQASLGNGAASPCSVTLTRTATVPVDISLTSSASVVQVPALVRIPAGTLSAPFTATAAVTGTGTSTLSARAGWTTKTDTVAVTALVSLTTFSCAATTVLPGGATTCTVTLSAPAQAGGATVGVSSSAAGLQVPASVTIPAGTVSTTFQAAAPANAVTGPATLTASFGTARLTFPVTLSPIKPVLLSCAPNPLTSGGLTICKVDLNVALKSPLIVIITSSSTALRVPSEIFVPTGAQSGYFVGYTDSLAPSQTVKVNAAAGFTTVTTNVGINRLLSLTSVNPLAAASVQAGEAGDEPASRQPAKPALVNAASALPGPACSPGAAAMFIGEELFPSGDGEVSVEINGEAVPVLLASPSRVVFQCPDVPAGAWLNVVLIHGGSATQSVMTEMQEATPGVFTMHGDGSGAGVVLRAPDSDIVSVIATGLGQTFGSGANTVAHLVLVTVDGLAAEVVSADAIGSGVYQIDVRLPESVAGRNAVAIRVEIPAAIGILQSNTVEAILHE